MYDYHHILFATDLDEDALTIGQRAVGVAQRCGAKISLLHVVEMIAVDIANDGITPQLQAVEAHLRKQASDRLSKLTQDLELDDSGCHVTTGPTKIEIVRFAEENGVDLIVVGKHSRHGIARLLGSTANAVLHSAPCDVLAVKVGS